MMYKKSLPSIIQVIRLAHHSVCWAADCLLEHQLFRIDATNFREEICKLEAATQRLRNTIVAQESSEIRPSAPRVDRQEG
jgi:hypothetical protein